MPKICLLINLLIFKDLFKNKHFKKGRIVTFFVLKKKYLLNHHQLDRRVGFLPCYPPVIERGEVMQLFFRGIRNTGK